MVGTIRPWWLTVNRRPLQRMRCQLSKGLEVLGNSSEVDRFRVQIRYRLFIEGGDPIEPPHLLNQE
jgi:hypothetical protein